MKGKELWSIIWHQLNLITHCLKIIRWPHFTRKRPRSYNPIMYLEGRELQLRTVRMTDTVFLRFSFFTHEIKMLGIKHDNVSKTPARNGALYIIILIKDNYECHPLLSLGYWSSGRSKHILMNYKNLGDSRGSDPCVIGQIRPTTSFYK